MPNWCSDDELRDVPNARDIQEMEERERRWRREDREWVERAIGDGQSDDAHPTDTSLIGPDGDATR